MISLVIGEIINEIYLWSIIISGIIGGVAGIVSLIITFYYNRKLHHYNQQLLQLYKKDRERPAIVELIRFFISPLIDWFFYQKYKDMAGYKEFEEFNINKLINLYKYSNLKKSRNLPDPIILYMEFDSLLERQANKSKWDEKVQEYNKLTRSLNEKINELEHNVRKFIDENYDVKRIYNDTEVNKRYTFDEFKNELTNKFYIQYRQYRDSLSATLQEEPWIYLGKEIFEQAINCNKSILEEIEKLKENRKQILEELIKYLIKIQLQLRVEYDLAPSDLTSQISFSPRISILRF
jgi:hypothetical protein